MTEFLIRVVFTYNIDDIVAIDLGKLYICIRVKSWVTVIDAIFAQVVEIRA